jgi:hypothetical protein
MYFSFYVMWNILLWFGIYFWHHKKMTKTVYVFVKVHFCSVFLWPKSLNREKWLLKPHACICVTNIVTVSLHSLSPYLWYIEPIWSFFIGNCLYHKYLMRQLLYYVYFIGSACNILCFCHKEYNLERGIFIQMYDC